MSNMDLWNKIADPDTTLSDKATKPVPGGAGLTAIDPFTLYAMATKLWGPIGLAYSSKEATPYPAGLSSGYTSFSFAPDYPCWGFEEVSERELAGEHVATVRFWYPHDGKMRYVVGKGCTAITGKPAVDKDCAKKSLTDACTNAMAKVGFGANVYLGKYNDSQYAKEVKTRQSAQALSDDPAVLNVRTLFAQIAEEAAAGVPIDGLLDRFRAVHGGPYKALPQAMKDLVVGEHKALQADLFERKKASGG